MTNEFQDRVALVTGAGDEIGLGFAHASYLAERGAKIVLNDFGNGTLGLPEQGINPDIAEQGTQRIRDAGGEAIANNGDVADPATAQAMVASALETWGRVDILINNAGFASASFFPDIEADDMHRHVGVTLLGCLNTAKAAWPHMVERGYGRIINTGSPACFGNPTASYAATKSGLFGFTRTEAIFGQAHNITANLLLPAAISRLTEGLPESPFKSHLRTHFGAERVAPVVAHLVSDQSNVTGEAFTVGGGQFARIVYAASPAQEIDFTMESVAQGMADAMDTSNWTPQGSTAESLVHLGMPPELEQM